MNGLIVQPPTRHRRVGKNISKCLVVKAVFVAFAGKCLTGKVFDNTDCSSAGRHLAPLVRLDRQRLWVTMGDIKLDHNVTGPPSIVFW